MKVILQVLFAIIFFGCKSVGDKNINQQVGHQQESAAELYPIDSALFEIPCSKESFTPIAYRGDIRYAVKDVDVAEKQIKETIGVTYSLEPHTRNESFSNGILYKSYQYTIPTKDFLVLERKLDSLLGKAESKYVNKTAVNYDFLIGNLTEEQKIYKMYVARYNNPQLRFQEKNDLLPIIGNCAKNIKNAQYSIQISCENKSALTVQISAKL